ncbi:MAG: ferritin family protein [candidate division Zixibacteria bacterium]|nr:ferritin family protein [candidate division Zixibacteria bacterium]
MDIADFAMKMERDGKAYYEKQASLTADPELKKILLTLAEEEENHYRFFRTMKENPDDLVDAKLTGPDTLKHVKNIFEEMARQSDKAAFGADAISAWKEARLIEEKSVAFYLKQAEVENDPTRKALLEQILEEERNHVLMIDGILIFLKQPAAFADSAQFKNFLSLEGR